MDSILNQLDTSIDNSHESYDEDEYFFNNINKLLDNNYYKDNKEFREVYSLLRDYLFSKFHSFIYYDLSDFYFQLYILYCRIDEEKFSYDTIKQSLYFIDRMRQNLKIFIGHDVFKNNSKQDERVINFIKDEIKYNEKEKIVFSGFYGEYNICKNEYENFNYKNYIDFLFPRLIWDDELYSGFCAKYFYKRASDYDTLSNELKEYIETQITIYNRYTQKVCEDESTT